MSRWWESLAVVASAVAAGAAVGAWVTENDWVQLAAMLTVAAVVAFALHKPKETQ